MYSGPVQDLVDELGRLPGIGPKSAQRIAFHLLKVPKEEAMKLSRAIVAAKAEMQFCDRCFDFATTALCPVCSDEQRKTGVICVVEEPRDVAAIERTHEYAGRYHVLHGALDPLQGIGPERLRVMELLRRIADEEVVEVIIATNPNLEGETTAMYLVRQLQPLGVSVSRLASGLPVGGDLEYADELTLGRAIEGRRTFNS